ncbi:MAG: DUF2628 domain-containing protein [Proteobacteria bacterium]|nr:DUF2628 domain-containing protein [Pseudomonadota bacterium]
MRFYSVHLRRHGLDPDRDIVLVKEGFSWPALLFSFLWALWHRLWLAAAAIFLAVTTLNAAVYWLRPDALSQAALSLGLGVIVGYLGNDFRRRKLTKLGFAFAGAVSGDDPDQALRRYLDNQPALATDLKS